MSKHALTRRNEDFAQERLTSIITPSSIWVDAGTDASPSLASYLEIPFRDKRLILTCILLSLVAGWLAIVIWPRSYASEAKLKLRVGRDSVALDPTVTTGATMMLQKSHREEIVSAMEVLGSRRIAEMVVDKLGLDSVLTGVLPSDSSMEIDAHPKSLIDNLVDQSKSVLESASGAVHTLATHLGVSTDISKRELAVMNLMSRIKIESPADSTIVNLEVQSKSPAMAQAIGQTMIESFLDESLDGALTDGSLEFFQAQTRELEERLNQLVRERSRYMQENKIVSIEANRTFLQEQLIGINRDLVLAYGDLENALAQANDLALKSNQAEDEVVALKAEKEDVTWSGMRQSIYELELEEQLASANYTDSHPYLKRIRSQLAGARKILESQKSDRVDLSTTPNPVKIDLKGQLQVHETTIAGLKSQIDEDEQLQAEMRDRIEDLLEQERFLVKLDRDIRLMETNLEALHEKLEEARVLDQLHADKISNIHIVQPPTFVEKPVSPKKPILAVGFLLLGLSTGLGLSLLRYSTSNVLRSSDDVESLLGVPVLASIPRLPRMTVPRPKEKRLYRQKCQAVLSDVLLSHSHTRGPQGRSLGIISVDAGAGATTLAMHLAATSSTDCRTKTVLVDADSRQRSISKIFGLNGTPGLVELVSGDASHDECLQHVQDVDLVASAADSCTDFLTSSAPEIIQALQAFLHNCDLLIVDLPAASHPDQAVALAQHLDSVIVVVEAEKTEASDAERLLRRLSESNTQVVGVVLSKTRNYLPKFVQTFVAKRD